MTEQEDDALHAATHDEALPPPSGDLEQLFQNHHGRVFGAAYRITGSAQDAEDVLQTVFLRLLNRQGELDLNPSPGSYLHRAAINAALDLMRSRARRRALPIDELEPAAPRTDDPTRPARDREIRRCLRRAILALTPKSAELFSLRFLEGLSNREIAESVRSSQTAVGVALHRARRRVRKDFGACIGGIDHV